MRIVVFSDSHNHFHPLLEIVRRHENADCFLHLGDGARELADLRDAFSDKRIEFVKGNCDFGAGEPEETILDFGEVRIFLTHGCLYRAKQGWDLIFERAREVGARIACFGHTHQALNLCHKGIHLLNPGSTSRPRGCPPSYGLIDLTPAGIAVNIVKL